MTRERILYIFDSGSDSNPVLTALRAAGYEVVSTNSSMQAIALLFLLHPIAAVVLDHRATEVISFDVARSLKAVRADVPIILVCRDQIDRLPLSVDAFVSASQSIAELTSGVRSSPPECGACSPRCLPSAQRKTLIPMLLSVCANPRCSHCTADFSRPGSTPVTALPDVKILLAPDRYPCIAGADVCPGSTLFCGASRL